jgi:uncharacterized membrane protein SpoIIM required for sporulation/uncharacterized RDD family membrane protein YckC
VNGPGAAVADLVVDSATGVDVHIRVAGPGARSLAYVIDWHIRVILAVTWFAVAAMMYNRAPSLAPHARDAGWVAAVLAPAAAIYFLYHWVLELTMRGSTPGKRMTGIRIASRDGSAPTAGALLVRNVFRLIDSLPIAYGVGLLEVILTRQHVRIGDIAAGTLLVYDHVVAPPPRLAASVPDRVRAEAIGELLQRWRELDRTARQRLAREVLGPAARALEEPQAPDDDEDRELRASLERLMRNPSGLSRTAVARARRLASGRAHDTHDALSLLEDYRLLAHDLAVARRLMPDSRAREYLETAYAQVHSALHRPAARPLHTLVVLIRDEVPRIVAELRFHIAWVTALFTLSIGAGFALVRAYPELIALFASPDMIAAVERGELWTAGLLTIAPSSIVSAQVLTNNIVVSLFAFCAGFLFGLGTFYIVSLNGITLGAVFAFTAQHGLAGKLFGFVLPHGCVELSVMCLSGAAGAAVGEALIRPGTSTRSKSFQIAALQAGKLLVPCALLLVGCGLIEGYFSPDPAFPLWSRALVGGGYWLFMLALLSGGLFGRLHRLHLGRAARSTVLAR